jgi:hypothetical protein
MAEMMLKKKIEKKSNSRPGSKDGGVSLERTQMTMTIQSGRSGSRIGSARKRVGSG